MSTAAPTLFCQVPSFYLFLVKMGHNTKTIAFRVMPLALQLVMMNKYSKSGVDTEYTLKETS